MPGRRMLQRHIYIYIHTHTHIHVYIYTYIHTYMYIYCAWQAHVAEASVDLAVMRQAEERAEAQVLKKSV